MPVTELFTKDKAYHCKRHIHLKVIIVPPAKKVQVGVVILKKLATTFNF